MSTPLQRLDRKPLIGLVDRAHRALQVHMVREAHQRGHFEIRQAHNAVFARLTADGARASELAALAGMTRQSMGELIRELVELGVLEMTPDPDDRRAKRVTYTEAGAEFARGGYQHLAELEKRFAEEFGAEEYETARDVLDRLVGLLEELERPTT